MNGRKVRRPCGKLTRRKEISLLSLRENLPPIEERNVPPLLGFLWYKKSCYSLHVLIIVFGLGLVCVLSYARSYGGRKK